MFSAMNSMYHYLSIVGYPNASTYFLLVLHTLVPQLNPLTEKKRVRICGLEQSLRQAEVLIHGLEQLHQSLAVTVAISGCLADDTNSGSFTAISDAPS
jgi:hypothetical protein